MTANKMPPVFTHTHPQTLRSICLQPLLSPRLMPRATTPQRKPARCCYLGPPEPAHEAEGAPDDAKAAVCDALPERRTQLLVCLDSGSQCCVELRQAAGGHVLVQASQHRVALGSCQHARRAPQQPVLRLWGGHPAMCTQRNGRQALLSVHTHRPLGCGRRSTIPKGLFRNCTPPHASTHVGQRTTQLFDYSLTEGQQDCIGTLQPAHGPSTLCPSCVEKTSAATAAGCNRYGFLPA